MKFIRQQYQVNHVALFQIVRSLEDVGLTDQKDHFSKQLSGGQKRKLSVAIALIGDPKVCGMF